MYMEENNIVQQQAEADSEGQATEKKQMKLEEQLMKLPEEIKQLEEQILDKTIEVEEDNENIDIAIIKIESEIVEEKDIVTNKAIFTNEAKRKNELKLRIGKDEALRDMFNAVKIKKKALKLEEIKLNFKKNLFKSFRVLAMQNERII